MHVNLIFFLQNLVIHVCHNDEIIIDVGFSNYFTHMTQLFSKFFLAQLTRMQILNVINFIKNYGHYLQN